MVSTHVSSKLEIEKFCSRLIDVINREVAYEGHSFHVGASIGVALAPAAMFARQLASESIRRPFATEVSTGSYWLTRLQSRGETSAMLAFRGWLLEMAAVEARGR